ncbi:TPA: hypothetical protein I7181_18160 [Vibrio vulnificus]|nr:hypothetical protein [Vibrio vulnificus]
MVLLLVLIFSYRVTPHWIMILAEVFMAEYYALLTDVGLAEIANAAATGQQIQLSQMSVGDGNDSDVIPDQSQTTLVNETYRASLNYLGVDPDNSNYLIAEFFVPSNIGGFTVRESGLWDEKGQLIAVGNTPPTYKPVLSEGASKELTVRMIIEVNNADAVNLVLDPTVVLANRKWVLETIAKNCVNKGEWKFGSLPKFVGDANNVLENVDYFAQPSGGANNVPSSKSGHLIARFISTNYGYQWFIVQNERWFRKYAYGWGDWSLDVDKKELVLKNEIDFGDAIIFTGDLNSLAGKTKDVFAKPSSGTTNAPTGNAGYVQTRSLGGSTSYQYYHRNDEVYYRHYDSAKGWSPWVRQATGLYDLHFGVDGAVPLTGGMVMQWVDGALVSVPPKGVVKQILTLPLSYPQRPYSVVPSVRKGDGSYLSAVYDYDNSSASQIAVDVYNPSDFATFSGTPVIQVIGRVY